jgi:hypothetical protein
LWSSVEELEVEGKDIVYSRVVGMSAGDVVVVKEVWGCVGIGF